MMISNLIGRIWRISRREVRIFSRRPLFLCAMVIAPLFCLVFFVTLMHEGLPTDLPAGIVDEDNTNISRIIVRTIDAMQEADFSRRYASFSEARAAMQRGEIYAFFHIPKGTTEEALASRQPRLAYYTNESYLVPGSLLMKDFHTAGELAGLALTRETLYGRGATEDLAMAIVQPIQVETHPIGNPALDYSVYLSNIIVPGLFMLLIMLATAYTIGYEWKTKQQRALFRVAGNSASVALIGKLLPQTALFSLWFILCDVVFYKIMAFPCNCPFWHMVVLSLLTVVAAQAFGVFFFGIFLGKMRVAMCMCSLWGILSFSIAGFTFPAMAMSTELQWLSWLFPLRHYYLIYVNQALNGYSISYVWPSVVALATFIALPLTLLWRYRIAFLVYKYQS